MDRYEEQEQAEGFIEEIERSADNFDATDIQEIMTEQSNFDDDYMCWMVELATIGSDKSQEAVDGYIRRAKLIRAFNDHPTLDLNYSDIEVLEVCAGREAK